MRFHPTNSYDDPGAHGAANQYFLYVGLFAPPLSEDNSGQIIEGGLDGRPRVDGKDVHFRGEFRFESGDPSVRKHLALAPTLMYVKDDPFEFKQIAFNNFGGLEGHAAEDLFFDFIEFGWSSGGTTATGAIGGTTTPAHPVIARCPPSGSHSTWT